MAIQTTLRNTYDADTIHVTVRCDEKTHRALKAFMHCKDAIAIRFPSGVGMFARGRGWYRMEAARPDNALQALTQAMKIIRRFLLEAERATTEAIKLLMPAVTQGLRVSSFSNAHSEGEYGYLGARRLPADQVKASPNRLAALANRFNSKYHRA